MSDVANDPFGLGPAASAGAEPLPPHILKGITLALNAVPYVGVLIALFGAAVLWMMLAPDRQRRGVDRLRQAPISSLIFGVLLWTIPALILVGIIHKFGFLRMRGQILIGLWIFFSGSLGYAVTARALGERMLPDRGAVVQTMLGLMGLVVPLFTLFGLPVLLIGAPLGLGAWITARRPSASVPTDDAKEASSS